MCNGSCDGKTRKNKSFSYGNEDFSGAEASRLSGGFSFRFIYCVEMCFSESAGECGWPEPFPAIFICFRLVRKGGRASECVRCFRSTIDAFFAEASCVCLGKRLLIQFYSLHRTLLRCTQKTLTQRSGEDDFFPEISQSLRPTHLSRRCPMQELFAISLVEFVFYALE